MKELMMMILPVRKWMMLAQKLLVICLKSQETMVTEGQVLGMTEGYVLLLYMYGHVGKTEKSLSTIRSI